MLTRAKDLVQRRIKILQGMNGNLQAKRLQNLSVDCEKIDTIVTEVLIAYIKRTSRFYKLVSFLIAWKIKRDFEGHAEILLTWTVDLGGLLSDCKIGVEYLKKPSVYPTLHIEGDEEMAHAIARNLPWVDVSIEKDGVTHISPYSIYWRLRENEAQYNLMELLPWMTQHRKPSILRNSLLSMRGEECLDPTLLRRWIWHHESRNTTTSHLPTNWFDRMDTGWIMGKSISTPQEQPVLVAS